MANLLKNHCLAGALSDVALGSLLTKLRDKVTMRGGVSLKVDPFFPSTKRCGKCHHVVDKLPLSQRVFTCPACPNVMDRDDNAADKFRQEAIRLYAQLHESSQSPKVPARRGGPSPEGQACGAPNLPEPLSQEAALGRYEAGSQSRGFVTLIS